MEPLSLRPPRPFTPRPPSNSSPTTTSGSTRVTQAHEIINLPTVNILVKAETDFWAAEWSAGRPQDIMWNVEGTGIFTLPCSRVDCTKVTSTGLADGWEATLDNALTHIHSLSWCGAVPHDACRDATKAFFLGDELLGEGTPTANVSAVAARVKASFPDALVYTNAQTDAFRPGTGGAPCAGSARCHGIGGASCCYTGGLPASIDAVSVDIYTGPLVGQSGEPRNLSSICPHSAWQTFEAEADCVFEFYRTTVYPLMAPRQKVFVVPGTFGAMADRDTDEVLVRKFDRYWELAAADARVVGINPWHFNAQGPSNQTWLNQFHCGAEQFPQLLAAMAAKGAALRSKRAAART